MDPDNADTSTDYGAITRILAANLAAWNGLPGGQSAIWMVARDLSELFAETDLDFDPDEFLAAAGFAPVEPSGQPE